MERILTATVLAVLITACGSDSKSPYDHGQTQDDIAIQDCVSNGGHPLFTSDQQGFSHYITCEPKVAP